MLAKIILVFLLGMAGLAFFGKLRFGGRRRLSAAKTPVICKRCGTPIPGPGNCACGAARPKA